MMKLLSVCTVLMLSCSTCFGINIHKATTNERDGPHTYAQGNESSCPCLPWNQVFGSNNSLFCGYLDTNGTMAGVISMEKGTTFQLFMSGSQILRNCLSIATFHSNVCLKDPWGGEDHSEDAFVPSKCFISAECAKTTGPKGFVMKTCTSGTDTLLADLPLREVFKLAQAGGLPPPPAGSPPAWDYTVLALFGGVNHDGLYNTAKWDGIWDDKLEDTLRVHARSPLTTHVYWDMGGSMMEPDKHRLVVRGQEVYEIYINNSTKNWEYECKRGCE